MLVLRRNQGEAIILNDDIVIRVLAVQGDRVKLGIMAPADVNICREELLQRREEALWLGPAESATDVWAQREEAAFVAQLMPWQDVPLSEEFYTG